MMFEAREWLRDALLQAACHSDSSTMHMLAEVARDDLSPTNLRAVSAVKGCPYVDQLRILIADHQKVAGDVA